MSVEGRPVTGRSTVYDKDGRTIIPKPIRDKMDLEEGDKVSYIWIDGDVFIYKEGEDVE